MQRRVAVRGIMTLDGKLLCARLKPYDGGSLTSDLGEYWCVPGGGLDPGEALVAGLEREIIEETGIAPEVGSLLYIQQFAHGGREHLEFFFHVLNAADYQGVDLAQATHGVTEIAELAFINPAQHRVLPEFLAHQNFAALTPAQPTTVFNYM